MTINYVYAESTVRPNTIEQNANTVYLRNNIVDETRTDDDGNEITFYTYQEATLTKAQYDEYAAILIASNQNSASEDTLTLMEAIADLYDVIALMA